MTSLVFSLSSWFFLRGMWKVYLTWFYLTWLGLSWTELRIELSWVEWIESRESEESSQVKSRVKLNCTFYIVKCTMYIQHVYKVLLQSTWESLTHSTFWFLIPDILNKQKTSTNNHFHPLKSRVYTLQFSCKPITSFDFFTFIPSFFWKLNTFGFGFGFGIYDFSLTGLIFCKFKRLSL